MTGFPVSLLHMDRQLGRERVAWGKKVAVLAQSTYKNNVEVHEGDAEAGFLLNFLPNVENKAIFTCDCISLRRNKQHCGGDEEGGRNGETKQTFQVE